MPLLIPFWLGIDIDTGISTGTGIATLEKETTITIDENNESANRMNEKEVNTKDVLSASLLCIHCAEEKTEERAKITLNIYFLESIFGN